MTGMCCPDNDLCISAEPHRGSLPRKLSHTNQIAATPFRQNLVATASASMKTTWKEIAPVPTTQEFLDIVLSRTQRRLPTQIRAGFKISRIRAFYTRKVKYTQETFTEKLSAILEGFPRLQDIHPFRQFWRISNCTRIIPWLTRNNSRQGPVEHPLRCRSFPHSSWPTLHRKASHRDRVSGLCQAFEVRPVAFSMQATQAGGPRPYGDNMQAAQRPTGVPRAGTAASGTPAFYRSQH